MTKERTKKPVTNEIATAEKDLDIYAGWIKRLENPDPVLRTEAGGKGLKLYDEVERDAHAGAVLQQRYLSIVGKEWEVVPADVAPKIGRQAKVTQEQKIADFVAEVIKKTNYDPACQEQLAGVLYGYYAAEIMWEASEGDVWIGKIYAKHPRRVSFTPQRELRLLTPQNMIEGEEVPERKFSIFTYGSTDNPYGKGLGQSLWWPVWFKKNGVKFWAIFLEKFGMPTTVGKYPQGTGEPDQQKLLNAIKAIQTDTGIIIPDGMAVDLLEATRRGEASYPEFCDYWDKQISKRVLGQVATTEGTPGRLGTEETQNEVRQEITKADADLLSDCHNETFIRWLVDYNFGPQKAYPKLWRRCEPEQDLKALAERDKIIFVDMGMGKRVPESYIGDTYGIPLAEEGEPVIGVPMPASPISPLGPQFSEKATASQKALDKMVEGVLRTAPEAIKGLSKPIIQAIEGATGYEEIQEKLTAIFSEMAPEQLEDLISRVMFAAEMYGRYRVNTETRSPLPHYRNMKVGMP
jgi:phage gp29-like protein